MGPLRRFWTPFFGKPSGLIGQVGARLLASMKGKFYRSMAAELGLQADDELLGAGCGSAKFFTGHAGHVRYVAGSAATPASARESQSRSSRSSSTFDRVTNGGSR